MEFSICQRRHLIDTPLSEFSPFENGLFYFYTAKYLYENGATFSPLFFFLKKYVDGALEYTGQQGC